MNEEVQKLANFITALKDIGVYSFKSDEFEVVFKVDTKPPQIVPLKTKSEELKSIESELYKDLDERINIPQLNKTV